MKRWQCTVCGYIHEGPEPPDECPVCGADRSAFVELPAEAAPAVDAARDATQWSCTVCGYAHTGPEPPAECPVCGADRSQFVPLDAAATAGGRSDSPPDPAAAADPQVLAAPVTSKAAARYAVFLDLAFRYHFHPIAVHVPNGVVPISLLFILLGALFGSESLGIAAAYNTIFVALFMPVVLWSGYLHWKHRFKAARTRLFTTKIACGIGLQALSLVAALWYLVAPGIALQPTLLYVTLHLTMLVLGGVAGFLGGRLVFNRPRP